MFTNENSKKETKIQNKKKDVEILKIRNHHVRSYDNKQLISNEY